MGKFDLDVHRLSWKITAGSAAILAGIATRAILTQSWRQFRKSDPPLNPESSSVSWGDALLWTALTGSMVGVVRLVVTRSTAIGWHKVTGLQPPE